MRFKTRYIGKRIDEYTIRKQEVICRLGVTYPSLKKLFLAAEDPTEYIFAKQHLLGWEHWIKLNGNAKLKDHFDRWRFELEIAIRAASIQNIMEASADTEKGFQANKWLADKGWSKRGAGRPSKEEIDKEEAIKKKIQNDFDEDLKRLRIVGD